MQLRTESISLRAEHAREYTLLQQQRRQEDTRKLHRVEPTREASSSNVEQRPSGRRLNARA